MISLSSMADMSARFHSMVRRNWVHFNFLYNYSDRLTSEFCQLLLMLNVVFCLKRHVRWQYHFFFFSTTLPIIYENYLYSAKVPLVAYLPDDLKGFFCHLQVYLKCISSLSVPLCSLNLHRYYFFRYIDQKFIIKMETAYENVFCRKLFRC